mmetsp:Transcript_78702/g.139641  ORF Transcript_78702/g.139641 Transcript_78702/m.139641 type:complete len:216 (-) Transcript_78702:155-802(-)
MEALTRNTKQRSCGLCNYSPASAQLWIHKSLLADPHVFVESDIAGLVKRTPYHQLALEDAVRVGRDFSFSEEHRLRSQHLLNHQERQLGYQVFVPVRDVMQQSQGQKASGPELLADRAPKAQAQLLGHQLMEMLLQLLCFARFSETVQDLHLRPSSHLVPLQIRGRRSLLRIPVRCLRHPIARDARHPHKAHSDQSYALCRKDHVKEPTPDRIST